MTSTAGNGAHQCRREVAGDGGLGGAHTVVIVGVCIEPMAFDLAPSQSRNRRLKLLKLLATIYPRLVAPLRDDQVSMRIWAIGSYSTY